MASKNLYKITDNFKDTNGFSVDSSQSILSLENDATYGNVIKSTNSTSAYVTLTKLEEVNLKANTKYTISFYVRASKSVYIDFGDGWVAARTDWQRVSLAITHRTKDIYKLNILFGLEGFICFTNFQLEEGDLTDFESGNVVPPTEIGQVTVYYMDYDSSTEITSRDIFTGEVGSKYSISSKSINGYTYYTSSESLTGTFTKTNKDIYLYYKKDVIEPPTPPPTNEGVKAIGQFTIYDFHDVYSAPLPPENPVKDQLWLDTSRKPPVLMVYDGANWIKANDYDDAVADLNRKYIELDANAEGVNIELGKITTDLDTKLTTSEFTKFNQDYKRFEFQVKEGKGENLIANSRPTTTLRHWESTYHSSNSSSIQLFTGGENFEGETFNSGFWMTLNKTTDNWCGVTNHSLNNYKFNTTKKYRLRFLIYFETPHTALHVRIAHRSNSNIVFSGYINSNSKGYKWFDEVFTPTESGNEPSLIFLLDTKTQCRFYIPYVMLYEGELGNTWTPRADEIYGTTVKIDGNEILADYEDGTYTKMGRNGFKYHIGGTDFDYYALTQMGAYTHSSGVNRVKITLDPVFRGKKFKVIAFPLATVFTAQGRVQFWVRYIGGTIDYTNATFEVEAGCTWNNSTTNEYVNVGWMVIA